MNLNCDSFYEPKCFYSDLYQPTVNRKPISLHQRYKVTQPHFLKPGDTIGILAPARKVAAEELSEGIKILEGWGFNVRLGKNLFKEQNQFSGSDVERAADLQTMLDDEDVKAIISARGGYGTVRIIDQLDFSKFKQHPKW